MWDNRQVMAWSRGEMSGAKDPELDLGRWQVPPFSTIFSLPLHIGS